MNLSASLFLNNKMNELNDKRYNRDFSNRNFYVAQESMVASVLLSQQQQQLISTSFCSLQSWILWVPLVPFASVSSKWSLLELSSFLFDWSLVAARSCILSSPASFLCFVFIRYSIKVQLLVFWPNWFFTDWWMLICCSVLEIAWVLLVSDLSTCPPSLSLGNIVKIARISQTLDHTVQYV